MFGGVQLIGIKDCIYAETFNVHETSVRIGIQTATVREVRFIPLAV